MTNLTEQQKRSLLLLAKTVDEGEISAIAEEISNLHDRLDTLSRILNDGLSHTVKMVELSQRLPGTPGYTPVKGKDYFDGYTPVKGKDYFTEEDKLDIASKVQPAERIIEKVIPQDIVGETIVDKINELNLEPENQIDFEHIKGWKELILKLISSQGGSRYYVGGGGSGSGTSGVGAWSTPPEVPNKSITVFTVGASAPTDVVADGINYYSGSGYTYAAGQITFSQPPRNYVRYR